MAAAEALISTIARAFYDDDVVCLVDVLLRDKYLRDDDMALRLSLPAKQLRRTLQSMEEERLVKHELVDDLAMGGSQNTKFWYIDYNHAVHVIRLRIHLLQKKLQEAELRARSSSLYLCPGYNSKTCNGRYNESEAQQIVDPETGLFLCRECVRTYANHPNPPNKKDYTLQLLDNQNEVNKAMDDMRRVRVQFSAKVDMQEQPLRQGIFDLLQKVRSTKGAEPITSNLPSENIAMGIGSKRIAGTGRTAGILLKKQQKQGILSADGSFGGRGIETGNGRGGARRNDYDELTFLKNAIGQEIAFDLEKGGGARANLLATKGRVRDKLIDAAAMKVGMDLGLVARVVIDERERRLKRKREEKQREEGGEGKKKKHKHGEELHFLRDNLGFSISDMSKEEKDRRRLGYLGGGGESSDEDVEHQQKDSYYISDETDEFRSLPEDDRRAAFQAQYKAEVERQKTLLGITNGEDCVQSQATSERDDNTESIAWEDG
ncbi:hypothetical protein ACHAW5_006146 [Stephanodiscus triporus]|uniref:HTH TFE/IIEalpha-type domain-containing protein n=1 Tax=Stephanodiscus triporus TaxID=2934178 RepID=A0ABD3N609_9STRA